MVYYENLTFQVVVSVLGDQHANGAEAERVGYGEWVPWASLSEEKLTKALQNVLNDPKYASKAREHGSLVKDQVSHIKRNKMWQ